MSGRPSAGASAPPLGSRPRASSLDRASGVKRAPGLRKIRVGVCAAAKKIASKPMTAILSRFDRSAFDVIIFGDDLLNTAPIDAWPVVDCLMSWYSTGFPLEKARDYVKLRAPFCVNDLSMESVLRDRRKFYDVLKRNNIPTPRHVVLNRSGPPATWSAVVETEDAIEIDGVKLQKPVRPVECGHARGRERLWLDTRHECLREN